MKSNVIPFLLAAIAAVASPALSAPLYVNDFDTDTTASWTVNVPTTTPQLDTIANFYYDYSAIGVPPAPGGTTTRGLKLTANNSAGVFSGFSVSPTGKSFGGNYTVTFDLWQNYVGPLGNGGSGTTQLSTYGIGTDGVTPVRPGAAAQNQLMLAHTLDGNSASDYRVYSSAAPTSYASGNAVYAAPGGAINNTNSYYTTAFPSQTAPQAQKDLFPGQTLATSPGVAAGFVWREVQIDVEGQIAKWSIDGTLIATVPLANLNLSGGNIFFGHADTNSAVSTDPNDFLLNITLIDNVRVIPEPSSIAIVGAAVLGLVALGRRRR
jgi:hypothetical protein